MSKLKNFTRLGWVWLLAVAVISLHDGYLHAVGMSESPWTLVPQVKAVKVGEGHYKKAKNFYSPNPAHFFFNFCPMIRCIENWAANFSKIGSTFCHIQNNNFFLKKVGNSRLLFIYFRLFNTADNKQMFNKILPMTGVKPRTSGIEMDRSTNWATTTSPK